MSNVKEDLKNLKREILRSYNSGGQTTTDEGVKITWNQCENPKYTSIDPLRFVYVNYHGNGVHQTGIWDTQENKFVD